MEILVFGAGMVAGGSLLFLAAKGAVWNLRLKLNGARNDLIAATGRVRQINEECGFLRAQIEADAKYVDLGKRRAASRDRQNRREKAERAAKKALRA